MQLLTKELRQKFETLGSQENNPDPIVIAKYFYGSWNWLSTEYDPVTQIFFGYVIGHENEWWYFSLVELESYRGKFWVNIERDLYAGYQCLSEHLKALWIANL